MPDPKQFRLATVEDLDSIETAITEGLCALGDEDAILKRGHWGQQDTWNAVRAMNKARERIQTLKEAAGAAQ